MRIGNVRRSMATAMPAVFSSARVHHFFANFDMERTVSLPGAVRTWEWTNPHSWLWPEVPDGHGGVVTWGLEGGAPGELTPKGWSRYSPNLGDRVNVPIHSPRSGKIDGSFGNMIFEDGCSLGQDSSGEPPGGVSISEAGPSFDG